MFLVTTWAATLAYVLSGQQQMQDVGVGGLLVGSILDELLYKQGAILPPDAMDAPKPLDYPCLRDSVLRTNIQEGEWTDVDTYVMDDISYALDDNEIHWRKQVTFMLIGCPKCGTTTTCEYLIEHPKIIRNVGQKEAQCLYQNWNSSDPHCENWFVTEWLQVRPDLISGDMTPEYLFRTEIVIPRLKEAFPWAKLITILRDPIERAYSEYRMKVANKKVEFSGEKFKERVWIDLEHLRKAGLLPYYRFARGEVTAEDHVTWEDWTTAQHDMDAFEAFHGSHAEMEAWIRYQSDVGNGNLGRGLYRIELSRWMMEFPCERFLVLKMEDYQTDIGVETAVRRLHQHLGLDYVPLATDEAKNTRHSESDIQEDTRAFLERFFGPYNDRLHVILGDEWIDPW